jgi:hypothetical protein
MKIQINTHVEVSLYYALYDSIISSANDTVSEHTVWDGAINATWCSALIHFISSIFKRD